MRSLAPLALAGLLLSACSGEVAQLEREQGELRAEVEALEAQVGTLRTEMVEAGLLTPQQARALAEGGTAKRGKAPGKRGKAAPAKRGKGAPAKRGKGPQRGKPPAQVGHPTPSNPLNQTLTFTAQRTGTPPELPPLPDLERADSACGYRFQVRALQPLSDFPLNSSGLGKSGPLLLLEDGKPLKPHATPAEFAERCAGAFRHAGHAFLFSPSGSAEDASNRAYTLAHATEVPLPRGDDGRPMYWVYPGTTLTFSIASWDPSWGPMEVHLAGRVVTPSRAGATVRIHGQVEPVRAAKRPTPFQVQVTPEAPDDDWTVEITSPEDGPYLLLRTLTVGNADNALVITAEEAFAAGVR